MEIKKPVFFFLVFFSCYLVFSLAFVSAYQTGGAFESANAKSGRVKFIMEPVLKIIDDFKPVFCDSSGYITFRAYVENVAEFNITSSEAMIEDASNSNYYDMSSALSCTPKTKLISNQEIVCRLNVKELLSRIPSCPLEKTENMFYLSFVISYGGAEAKVTDSKDIVVAGSGVKPGMEIKFDISHPPYPIPEINCKTGSEIDVPVVIHNAETLFGEISWSFSANGTSSSVIDCTKILSRAEEGRDDIYICTLSVPNTIFADCEEGSEVAVAINAETEDYKLSDNFTTSLSSAELSLSLKLSTIGKQECQIIDEEGTCIPKEPQQNVTATITGNVPEKLNVFESRYKLGDDDVTTTLCKKLEGSKYECSVFVTLDKLTMPPTKNDSSSKDRDLTVLFDVKYMNYYTNISASTKVTLEGRTINEILNTQNVLKKENAFFEWIKKSNFQGKLGKAYKVLNFINNCCFGFGIANAIREFGKGSIKGVIVAAIKEIIKKALFGSAKNTIDRILTVFGNLGPNIINCIADKAIKDIEKESQKLQKFEKKEAIPPEELKIPTMSDIVSDYVAGCAAKSFWDRLKGLLIGVICGTIVVLVMFFAGATTGGAAAAAITHICNAVSTVTLVINLIMLAISILLLLAMTTTALNALALARERMSVQLNATNIMADYQGAFSQTLESMMTSMSVNDMLMNLTYASYGMGTVKLMFNSSRTGLLGSGDEICSGDRITIGYDLEKLNLTGNFRPELYITNSHSKTLHFDSLKGTFGPYDTDTLLGTEPDKKPPDPSEEYTFTLRYADKSLNYKLNYVNHPCG